jgi:predicted amidohydrolase
VEVQLCPAGWPVSRIEHWRTLARARAIEDQMFVVGANQVGEEDFGVDGIVAYGGKSMIVDPWGEVLAEGGEKEEVIVARIDLEAVQRARGKIPVLKDRRADVYGM